MSALLSLLALVFLLLVGQTEADGSAGSQSLEDSLFQLLASPVCGLLGVEPRFSLRLGECSSVFLGE